MSQIMRASYMIDASCLLYMHVFIYMYMCVATDTLSG